MPKPRIDENKVIEAALEEFTTYSYEEASLNRIIKCAGISKGSFYYRYETKYDIYRHLLKEGMKLKWAFIRKEMARSPQPGKHDDIYAIFLYQAEIGVRFAKSNPRYHKLAKMFSSEKGSEVYSKLIREFGSNDESQFEKMIDDAYERGDFSERFPRDFVQKVFAFLFQNFDDIFDSDRTGDLESTLNDMQSFVSFLKHGLA